MSKLNVVIIGNGIAGQNTAEMIRKKDIDIDINIFTNESYPYYTRIFLPHYIANERTKEKLILKNQEWFEKNNINIQFNTTVNKIEPDQKIIHVGKANEIIHYDKLVIATGSNPRYMDFGKPNIKGMFTLRSLNDADNIKNYIIENNVQSAFVIGGGLLGLELGYHLKELNLEISICEIAPFLLPRQLDKATSLLLQKYLESKGMKIICGENIEEILGEDKVSGILTKSGKNFKADLILQQLGIIPEITLAKDAKLMINRGIIVNEFMQTSDPNIYAAGDCVEFNGHIWGIIPASLDQSKIVAEKILEFNPEPYFGTFWNTRLKIAGLKLSCFGAPPSKEIEKDNLIENIDEDTFLCKKVIVENDILKSAILMGPGKDSYFLQNIGKEVDKEELKNKLNEK